LTLAKSVSQSNSKLMQQQDTRRIPEGNSSEHGYISYPHRPFCVFAELF